MFITSGEVEVELPVGPLSTIWCPDLLADPWYVLRPQRDAMVGNRCANSVHGQNMIVGHVILVTAVVKFNVGLPVVRGVDIDTAVEGVG